MKRTLHRHTKIFLNFFQKSGLILGTTLFLNYAAFAQTDIQVVGGNLKLVKSFKINERGTQGTLAADPNAVYSNVTTFSGSAYAHGGSALIGTNSLTTLAADSIGTIGSLPLSIGSFRFSVVNYNAKIVSARPLIRFYANDGTAGGPGTFIGGFSFNPINFDASSIQVYNTGPLTPFAITTQGFWAGITFDDNSGTTGISIDELDNLGQGMFGPVDVGSSTDDFFQTDDAGSFASNNPAGGTYDFGVTVEANFGWEFVSSIPLPVTLTDFKVQRSGVTNTLSWKTSQELNSNYFSIQRSIDGSIFTEIGRVKAAGKSATVKNYSFADAAPLKGNNYYRIKMVDLDNSGKFSDIKNVRNDALLVFSIFPNPLKEKLILEWNAESAGKAAIIITDMSGRILYSKESDIITGNNKVTIDASKFAKGIYNIKVTTGQDNYSHTFNKM